MIGAVSGALENTQASGAAPPCALVVALPNTSDAEILANVRANIATGVPWVQPREPHDGHAVLCGGGPSLAETVDEIAWRKSHGQTIFALNGANDWLSRIGVLPDHVVILDPRPENLKFVGSTVDSNYLLASQCHPSVVAAARDGGVQLWHFAAPGIENEFLAGSDATLVGGGITSGLTAMALVYMMGYRKIHLYGYDSSDRHGEAHAYAQAENTAEQKRVEVWCEGRKFTTSVTMYAQAEAFQKWAERLANAGSVITVHGDGLLPTIARAMQGSTIIEGIAA